MPPLHHLYRRMTPSQRALHDLKPYVGLHGFAISLITVLSNLAQSASSGASPVDAHSCIMTIFIVDLYVYVTILAAEFRLRRKNSIYSEVVGRFSLLSAALATIMLLVILTPGVGWTCLAVWVSCFVKASVDSYKKLHWKSLYDAVLEGNGDVENSTNRSTHSTEEQAQLPVLDTFIP